MTLLVVGLIVFLGIHLFTMARGWRAGLIAKIGEGPYKGLFSLLALSGLVLIVIGYGQYRQAGYIPVWDPPVWARHLALPLVWIAFVCFPAAYLPGRIKALLKHPMLAGVKTWAFAHLLANGDLGSILLFGSFLAWAVMARISVKYRGEPVPAPPPPGIRNDLLAVLIGTAAYVAFAVWLHPLLIGVPVLPGRG
ncbi:NnrU family protein [Microvirga alba]|uniref:NnrU family protein n=1 Tax=Microvirga alba TaxID=2791025 RepID=A0A931BSL7_9HYPH|nr:NnrU family protein [Microvirga alba]MBF9234029.1 NnrU family protein [Microvirga alba]